MKSKQMKILVIDDNNDNLTTVKALIQEAFPKALTLTSASGEAGITLAREEDPDAILLDIIMPKMDGFSVCLALKADERLCDIPVAFMTALNVNNETRFKAIEVGGEGFLHKPIDDCELAAQIRSMVKTKAAHVRERNEKRQLAELVIEQTAELKKELAERKIVEEELREREEFLSQIIENIPNMIFIKDARDLRFVRFNKAGEELLGYKREELIGKNDYDLFPKKQAGFFIQKDREVLEKGELRVIPEEPIDTKHGKRILITKKIPILDKKGKPAFLLGISEDITDMREIEARLRQSEKMEAIGRLAGGIAHDFNNVLGGIIGYTQMSLETVEKNSVIDNNLRKILKASQRAKHLVKQILTYSRQSNQEQSVIEVQPVILEALELVGASIPSSIRIESSVDASAKPVLADPTKIHEMVLNLATNAVYAMENSGVLSVRLYGTILDKEKHGRHRILSPGNYTVIEVSDTGSGIDAQIRDKIFDPFFTTKPVGEGAGMGLSVVAGIVESLGGDLQLESNLGKGSTFKIFLPVAKNCDTVTD